MSGISTYDEMDKKIKEFLRDSDDPMSLYAAARIEELEAELDAAKADMKIIADQYRRTAQDDGICGLCKQDADHGAYGYANECPGYYKDDCFEWCGKEKRDG